jgi:hypothetical protein
MRALRIAINLPLILLISFFLEAQARSMPDLDISVSINGNRKYLEFWVENWESTPVYCEYIKQRAEYIDAVTGDSIGFRTVSLRDITVQPRELLSEPEGGKDIIENWERVNRNAEILGLVNDFQAKCEIQAKLPPIPDTPSPQPPVCTTKKVPRLAQSSACNVTQRLEIDHVFTPWNRATRDNVKSLCPWTNPGLDNELFHRVSGNSRRVQATCLRYNFCSHSSHGYDTVTTCK